MVSRAKISVAVTSVWTSHSRVEKMVVVVAAEAAAAEEDLAVAAVGVVIEDGADAEALAGTEVVEVVVEVVEAAVEGTEVVGAADEVPLVEVRVREVPSRLRANA